MQSATNAIVNEKVNPHSSTITSVVSKTSTNVNPVIDMDKLVSSNIQTSPALEFSSASSFPSPTQQVIKKKSKVSTPISEKPGNIAFSPGV